MDALIPNPERVRSLHWIELTMDHSLVNDEIETAMRTIRLAQAQIANLKKKSVAEPTRAEQFESVELLLGAVLRRLEDLKLDA